MVYDNQSDRIVIFGGNTGEHIDETWAYDFESNTWTNMSPATKPSARSEFALAYDSQSDRIVLFGGWTGGQSDRNGETWAYDFEANTWTNMSPTIAPAARYELAMAYDSQSDRIVLFGGWTGSSSDETWAYDFETNAWTNMNPTTKPAARYGHAMAYDSQSDRTVLFGGLGGSDETWAYDFESNTWTNMNPTTKPAGRYKHAMAYDSQSDRTVLFGGLVQGTPNGETWSYDLESNTWTNMNPATRPSARWAHAMAYDSESDRVLLFGGSSGGDETWAYNFEMNSWTKMEPQPIPPSEPQNLQAIAGDAKVTLTWQAPLSDGGSPVTNYRIYRGTASGGESFLVEIGNVLTYQDIGLTNGQTYYYQVSAVNAVGDGPRSAEVPATPTPPTVPAAPQNLQAVAGNAQVSLTWQAPASDGGSSITNYKIYRATTSGGETLLTTVGNVLTHTDSGLANGQTYYYQVSAVNGVGEGSRSNEASATPTAPSTVPSAPQNFQALAANAQVTLTWQAPASNGGSAITGYKVYRGTASGGETLLTTLGAALTYTDTAATNGQTYYFQVSAVNAVGEGPKSNEVSATPTAPTDSNPPVIAIGSPANNSALTSTTATVTGTASDNVAVEQVELSTDGATWTLASGTTSWSGSVTLHAGTNLIYARATDTAGNRVTVRITVTVQTVGAAPQGLDPTVFAGILVAVGIVIVVGGTIAVVRSRRRRMMRPRSPPPSPPPPSSPPR